MKLLLVRHPQPQVAQGLCYGASDVTCSPESLESAALQLRNVLPKQMPIISSPLSRCEHLAHILCRLEPDLAYKTDAKLAEMNFGAWELKAWSSIAASELAAWTNAFATYRCGGSGESAGQFVQRVALRLHESAQTGEDQIWLTHAGVIRALQWLSGQSYEMFTALAQRHALGLRGELLSQLRASDWPKGALAWCQVLTWDWPLAWPALAKA